MNPTELDAMLTPEGCAPFTAQDRIDGYEADWRLAASEGKNITVDPALWSTQMRFVPAGGPDVHVLTEAGRLRATIVGTGLDRKCASALLALAGYGTVPQALDVPRETTYGGTTAVRYFPTELDKEHAWSTWRELASDGLVEVTRKHDNGMHAHVALTKAGLDALAWGYAEQDRLLARIRVAHDDALTSRAPAERWEVVLNRTARCEK